VEPEIRELGFAAVSTRMIELLFEAKGIEMTGPYPWS